MKKILLPLFLSTAFFANAQNVGIGTNTPHASAQLDITSPGKGILVPRMRSSARNLISSPATGLLVFDTDTNSFWFWTGTAWQNISPQFAGWALLGNSGTSPATHFIGTMDNNSLLFKVNNQKAGYVGVETNDGNIFWGYQSGNNNTGYSNVGIGIKSLFSNTYGSNLVAVGDSALFSNTTGNGNTAIGSKSLYTNTYGDYNTANGVQALYSNTTGYQNTANGIQALSYNTTGYNNTANGAGALLQNSTGNNNTANGNQAMYSNTTGSYNTANGEEALLHNTTGFGNSVTGYYALYSNTTGNYNTANGIQALSSNTTGHSNVGIGVNALYSNITGYSNVGIGVNTLFSNTNFSNLVAVGDSALFNNGAGPFSSFISSGNTAIGSKSLFSNTTGYWNTANGYQALYSTTSGPENTANGYQALYNNITGFFNTANGGHALFSNTTGQFNTAVGMGADVNPGSLNYATAIGATASVECNDCLVLGRAGVMVGIGNSKPNTPLTFSTSTGKKINLYQSSANSQYGIAVQSGQLQIYSDAPGAKISFGYYNSGSYTERMWLDNASGDLHITGSYYFSDLRYKKQITRLQNSLEKIMAINGVEYFMRTDEFPSKHFDDKLQVGLIAQEVEKVLPQVVQTDQDGYKAIDYAKVVPLLVEGIKEQQLLLEKQQKQIDELKIVNENIINEFYELKKIVKKKL